MTQLEIWLLGTVAVLWVLGGHALLIGIALTDGPVSRAEAFIIWLLWPLVAIASLLSRRLRRNFRP